MDCGEHGGKMWKVVAWDTVELAHTNAMTYKELAQLTPCILRNLNTPRVYIQMMSFLKPWFAGLG